MNAVYEKGFYRLIDEDGNPAGNVTNKGWFSSHSTIRTGEDQFELSQPGFFSAIKITRNGIDVGKIKSGWGSIHITMEIGSRIQTLTVTRKGMLKTQFLLKDESKNVLAVYRPIFRWTTMHCDFKIEPDPIFYRSLPLVWLLLGIYAVNKLRNMEAVSTG